MNFVFGWLNGPHFEGFYQHVDIKKLFNLQMTGGTVRGTYI